MANLYELMKDYESLQDAVEDDDVSEEDLELLLKAMEDTQGDLRTKVDNICRLLRNVGGEEEKFQAEERRLAARRKSLSNKRKRIKAWLKMSMDLLDIEKLKTEMFEVSIVDQGFRLSVVNETELPHEFVRVKRSPDMTRLNKAYKEDGEIPPGCELVPRKAMRIR